MSSNIAKALDLLQSHEGMPSITASEQADVLSRIPDNTKTGPQGGNLNNPAQVPEARRAPLNAKVDVTGLPTLHRFERQDTAVAGHKNELAWHRMAAFMLLAGRTNSEIALAAGVHPVTVSNLRAQRWFQELLAVLANETGQDLQAAVASHAHDAINRIAEIATGDIETYGSRNVLTACQYLVDQAKGKATQTILSAVSHTTHASPSEEMADIQQQLAALRSSAAKEA